MQAAAKSQKTWSSISSRWNPQVVAAAGYGVLLINPRGSTGYGQEFCDQICRDWGGRVVEDIEKAIRTMTLDWD